MSDVIPISRSRDLIEHRAFVAGILTAADLADQQATFCPAEMQVRFRRFAEQLRRKAHELADKEATR